MDGHNLLYSVLFWALYVLYSLVLSLLPPHPPNPGAMLGDPKLYAGKSLALFRRPMLGSAKTTTVAYSALFWLIRVIRKTQQLLILLYTGFIRIFFDGFFSMHHSNLFR